MEKRILLAIVKWLIQYVDGFHVAKNGGKRKQSEIKTEGSEQNG